MLNKSIRRFNHAVLMTSAKRNLTSTALTQDLVNGNSVFLRHVLPSKLTVPLSNGLNFEYTIDCDMTVE